VATDRAPANNATDSGKGTAGVEALADKAIRDQIESDRAAQLARDQKQLAEDKLNAQKSKAALAALLDNPVYARLDTRTDVTPTAPVFTPNILDAQTDDDLGLTSSPFAGTTATAATNTVVDDPKVVKTGGIPSVAEYLQSKLLKPAEPVDNTNVVTDGEVASVVNPPPVTNTKVATGNYKPTIDSKTGAVTDRLGNPVVTNAKGYGYFDPITGLAVTPCER
jgi:hypothetical protein